MKEIMPKFIVAVVGLAITALLTGLIFTMIDDNKSTYKEASKHIDELDNKNKDSEDNIWVCPHCGASNDRYEYYCTSCGEYNPWHTD